MDIRRKMFIIIVSAFTVIMLLFALSGVLLLRGFGSAEDQEVRSNVLRAGAVFSSSVDNLSVKVHDWSAWDDTYAFIADHNVEYVRSNLTPQSLQSIGVNMMIFIDRSGKVVTSRNINTTTLAELPLPDSLLPYLKAGSPLIQYRDLSAARTGVIDLPEGVLMVAARPIETSKQQGPARGTIIFGKYADKAFVEGLSKTIDFPITLTSYHLASETPDVAQAVAAFTEAVPTAVIPVNDQNVAGYALMKGIDGNPALVLRALMDRHTLDLGQKTVLTYVIFMFVTLAIISIGMWFLVDLFVLSRMARLSRLVASSGNAETEIVLPGSDEFSQLAGVINTLTSQLQESLHSLAKAKAKDDAILASMGDGLGVADESGRLIYLNAIGEDILGGTANDRKHTSWQKAYGVFDPKTLRPYPDSEQPLYLATQGKVVVKVPMLIRNVKHPEGIVIEVTATPIVDNNITIGGVAVFRDMSRERAVDAAKTEFVSLASHQLRTPLTSINWYTEMLQAGYAGELTTKQKKYLGEIYAGNKRMVDLVNSLLNVSRLELGTFVFEPAETDVVKLAQSVVKEQKPQAKEKKIALTTEFAKGLPKIVADPKLLRMVMQNLLSNAIKYTPDKGSVTFTVAPDATADRVLFSVADTGYGIPQSQQDKIFTKLFRADNARSKNVEGTGLGLYIVKSVVEHSGGTVWFESEENKGTTFHVSLPTKGVVS